MKKILWAIFVAAVIGYMGSVMIGHPIYGNPFVVDNRPLLKKPLAVSRLEDPNIVVTTTGERLAIDDIVFEPGTAILSPKQLSRSFLDSSPIRVALDPTFPSKVAFERKMIYFCGNSFRPARLFPKHLPSYEVADFGHGLVMRGLAKVLEKPDIKNIQSDGTER